MILYYIILILHWYWYYIILYYIIYIVYIIYIHINVIYIYNKCEYPIHKIVFSPSVELCRHIAMSSELPPIPASLNEAGAGPWHGELLSGVLLGKIPQKLQWAWDFAVF